MAQAGGGNEGRVNVDTVNPLIGGEHKVVAFDGVTMGEDEKREGKPLSAFSKEVLLSWSMFWTVFMWLWILAPIVPFIQQFSKTDNVCNAEPAFGCAAGFEKNHTTSLLGESDCFPTVVCSHAVRRVFDGTNCVEPVRCASGMLALNVDLCTTSNEFYCATGYNRTTHECIPASTCGFSIAALEADPPDYNIDKWNGVRCMAWGESCQVKFDFYTKFLINMIGAVVVNMILLLLISLSRRRLQTRAKSWLKAYQDATRSVPYEMIQLVVTMLGCISVEYYASNLNVILSKNLEGEEFINYYPSLTPQRLYSWILLEVFIVFSYAADMLARLQGMPAGKATGFVVSYYTIIDMLAFATVIYPVILDHQLPSMRYNAFMFVAPLRFLRLRRALQSLDNIRGGQPVRFLRFTISSRIAAIIILVLDIVVFILCSAAFVMCMEFPCDVIQDPSTCNESFQVFYLCIYYIVCTFSTVGYGDMYPATDLGRMVVAALIIFMLVQVPIQINALSSYFEEESQMDVVQRNLDSLAADLRRHLGIRKQLPDAPGAGSKTTGAGSGAGAGAGGDGRKSGPGAENEKRLRRWAAAQVGKLPRKQIMAVGKALQLDGAGSSQLDPKTLSRRLVAKLLFDGEEGERDAPSRPSMTGARIGGNTMLRGLKPSASSRLDE